MKKKSLSYGIDHYFRGLETEKYLINKYQDYIQSIYFGPLNIQLYLKYSRRNSACISTMNINEYLKLIDFARERNIKINITYNTINDSTEVVRKNLLNDTTTQYIKPDEICCCDEYLDIFKEIFNSSIFIRSFKSSKKDLYKALNLNEFDRYVIGNEYLLSLKLNNLSRLRILLNTACPFICKDNQVNCDSDNACIPKFFEEFSSEFFKASPEKYFAYHCLTGDDILLLEQILPNVNFDYKIGSRFMGNMGSKEIESILENYINNDPLNCFEIDYNNTFTTFCANHGFNELFRHGKSKRDASKISIYKNEFRDKLKEVCLKWKIE